MPLIRDSLWNGEIEIERCAYIQRTRHGLYKFKVLIKLITQMHYNFTNKYELYIYTLIVKNVGSIEWYFNIRKIWLR